MIYKPDSEEENKTNTEGIPARSSDERVKDALSQVEEALRKPSLIGELLTEDPEYRRGRELAIAYLSYRPRSSGKVRTKLAEKNLEPEVIEQVLRSLIEDGYLDDKLVAEALLRERRGRKAEGYQRAWQRLIAAGIPVWQAAESVAKMEEDVPELHLLAGFLKSKYRKELLRLRDGSPSREERRDLENRLMRAAEGRGFRYSDVSRLLRTWFED